MSKSVEKLPLLVSPPRRYGSVFPYYEFLRSRVQQEQQVFFQLERVFRWPEIGFSRVDFASKLNLLCSCMLDGWQWRRYGFTVVVDVTKASK